MFAILKLSGNIPLIIASFKKHVNWQMWLGIPHSDALLFGIFFIKFSASLTPTGSKEMFLMATIYF